MHRITLFSVVAFTVFGLSPLRIFGRESEPVSAGAIIHEINLARVNPGAYAALLQEMRYPASLRARERHGLLMKRFNSCVAPSRFRRWLFPPECVRRRPIIVATNRRARWVMAAVIAATPVRV